MCCSWRSRSRARRIASPDRGGARAHRDFPLLLGSVVLTRFDLLPAALVAGALAALVRRRDRLGLGLLGAAVAVKLYPAVLLPLALAYVWRRRGRREALICLGVAAAVVAVAFLPFLALAPGGLAHSIGHQLSRPLQIESLGVVPLPRGAPSRRARRRDAVGPRLAEPPRAGDGVPQHSFLARSRSPRSSGSGCARPGTADELVRWSAAALVAFVALGKVLSPQFLIWLVPLVPARRRGAGARARRCSSRSRSCSRSSGSRRGTGISPASFELLPSLLVLARDLVLVALLVVLVRGTRPERPRLR